MSSPPPLHELSFYALALVSLIGVARVMRRPETFVTFPVMAALVWTGYVLPQAFGILHNPRWIPEEIYLDGFVPTLLMSGLCVLAGLLGWAAGPQSVSARAVPATRLDPQRLLVIGGVFGAVLIAGLLYVASLSGGILQHYSVRGSYTLDWRGAEVIVSFFMLIFGNLAMILLAFSFFRRPTVLTGTVFLIVLAPNIADILVLNRRSDVVYLGVALATALHFARGWAPSRTLVLGGLALCMAVVFVFPVVRGVFLIGAQDHARVSLQTLEHAVVADVLGGSWHKEFNNSIGVVAAYDKSGEFGYGATTWNGWMQTSIPRSLFGEDFKESFKFPGHDIATTGMDEYGWKPVPYMSISAPARLFADFSYLGAAAFFFLAYAMRTVFVRAIRGDHAAQIVYTSLLLLTPHWIAIGHAKALRDLILISALVGVTLSYGALRPRRDPAGLAVRREQSTVRSA